MKSAEEFLHTLRLDSKTIKICQRALTITDFPTETIEIKRLLSKNDAAVVRCAAAVSDVLSKTDKENSLKKADDIIASGECVTLGELAVTGKDLMELGYSSGKALGETLSKLLEHVLENPEDNKREVLLSLLCDYN